MSIMGLRVVLAALVLERCAGACYTAASCTCSASCPNWDTTLNTVISGTAYYCCHSLGHPCEFETDCNVEEPDTSTAQVTSAAAAAAVGISALNIGAEMFGGGGQPTQAFGDFAGVINSMQENVMLGEMSSSDGLANTEQMADNMKIACAQFDPPWKPSSGRRSLANDFDPYWFQAAMAVTGLVLCLVALHFWLSRSYDLGLAFKFPVPELFVAKVLFGALSVSCAMVLDPTFDIEWAYPAAGWTVLALVAIPYVIIVWAMLRRYCKPDGEVCSFKPITLEKEDELSEISVESQLETSPISPRARQQASEREASDRTDQSDTEVYRPGTGCGGCCGWFREPVGKWHAGQAEAAASAHYEALRVVASKWLDELDELIDCE